MGFKLGPPPSLAQIKTLPVSGKDGEQTLEWLHIWLEQWNSEFEEFRAAGKRPIVYLPGDYSSPPTVPIQNFVSARTLAQTISGKAKVNLLLGHPEAARKDLESIETVMRGMETVPNTLVAAMIRTAIAGLYYDLVQEGLRADLWKPEQIKSIQEYTAKFDVITPVYKSMMDGERVALVNVLEMATSMQGGVDAARMMGSQERSRVRELVGALYPRGWIRQNQIYTAGVMDEFAVVLDAKNRRYHPERGQKVMARFSEEIKGFHPTRLFAAVAIPNFTKAYETAARNQTYIDLTTVACALEQFKSAKGNYPEQLAELAPAYLKTIPRDIVTGQPVSYKRSAPGKFLLYAVGSDDKDNGGDPKADWVWGVQ